jgi:hypothetical protein
VQEIEAAVGEHQLPTLRRILRAKGRQFIGGNQSFHPLMGTGAEGLGKKILLFSLSRSSVA